MDVIEFLKEIKENLEEVISLLDARKTGEAFGVLNQKIDRIQDYILLLAENQVLSIEDINEVSNLLVRAMHEQDGVLLLDVCKYALLDVANQLLEGNDE